MCVFGRLEAYLLVARPRSEFVKKLKLSVALNSSDSADNQHIGLKPGAAFYELKPLAAVGRLAWEIASPANAVVFSAGKSIT